MKAEIVVIGSGISGLTTAALLAEKRRDVIVLERKKRFGGALRPFSRAGIIFDVGCHYTGGLQDGQILDRLWRYCGVRAAIPVVDIGPQGYDSLEFWDGHSPVRGYFSYPSLQEELHAIFPKEIAGINAYFQMIQEVCASVPFYNMALPLSPFLRGARLQSHSLAAFFREHLSSPHLCKVLGSLGVLYGTPTTLASCENHALVCHGYHSGVSIIDGGGQKIVDAFLALLRRRGVRLCPDAEVTAVTAKGDRVRGVVLADGSSVSCRTVVYTGHPGRVVEMVPEGVFRPAYQNRLRRLRPGLSMFAVFGRSKKEICWDNGALNYFLLPTGREAIPEEDALDPFSAQSPMLMTGTGYRRRKLQRDGNGIILLRPGSWQEVSRFAYGARCEEYYTYKRKVAREMVRIAELRWGELTGEIEILASGSPLTFHDELSAPFGCTYGAMYCLGQYNPEVRTRLPGLYLGGQSTLMTGMLGASASAIACAGEIVGLEELWESIRQA